MFLIPDMHHIFSSRLMAFKYHSSGSCYFSSVVLWEESNSVTGTFALSKNMNLGMFFQISIIALQFGEYLQVASYVKYFYASRSLIFQEQ